MKILKKNISLKESANNPIFLNLFINLRFAEELVNFILSYFFLNLYIKAWASFIEVSPWLDEQIQEKLIIRTFWKT